MWLVKFFVSLRQFRRVGILLTSFIGVMLFIHGRRYDEALQMVTGIGLFLLSLAITFLM